MRHIKLFEIANYEDDDEFTGDVYNYNCEGMIYLQHDGTLYQPSILVERHTRSDYLVYEHNAFHVKVITYETPVTPAKEAFEKVPRIVVKLVKDAKEDNYGRNNKSRYKPHRLYPNSYNEWCDKLENVIKNWRKEISELDMYDETEKYNL